MDVRKSDCIAIQQARVEMQIAKNTINSYIAVLQIEKRKFPLDSKLYISKRDYERIKAFIASNKEEQ